MRIDGSAYVVDLSRTEAVPGETGAAAAVQGSRPAAGVNKFDRVEISSAHPKLEQLKRDLDALPDVRLDRVALARQTVQDGSYRVEPGVLAQKMMEAFGA
jgi:negative regulator of flagellin synthesis FlgM